MLSGKFMQVDGHVLHDRLRRGSWTDEVHTQLIADNGSSQNLGLPIGLKELYKAVWEIKQRIVLDMAADRGGHIDQAQLLNSHMIDTTTAKLSAMHFRPCSRSR